MSRLPTTWPLAQLIRSPYLLSIFSVSGITVLVKALAAVKEIAIAWRYGVSDELDAYLIAFVYVLFMVNIIGNALISSFMPTYIRVRETDGTAAAQALLANVSAWCVISMLMVCLVLALLSSWVTPLLASGFDARKLSRTFLFAYIMLPIPLLSGMSTLWGAVLNAHNHFKLAAFTPICVSAAVIVLVSLRGRSWGGLALAIGTLAGYCVESIMVGRGLARHGLLPLPRVDKLNPQIKAVISQFVPLMIASSMTIGAALIDQAMAAMLAPGSVSALNYGSRPAFLIFSLSAAVWIVALPKFSNLAAARQTVAMKRLLNHHLLAIMAVGIPLGMLLIVWSTPIVGLLFQRGAFSPADTALVARIQACYALQTPFYIALMVMMRMLSALNRNHILMLSGAISLALNIGFNLIGIHFFGVAGIALSTSGVAMFSFVFLLVVLRRALS